MKTIVNYSTKQKGYGRQGLYVDVVVNGRTVKDVYVQDVYPNVEEHFDFVLNADAVLIQEKDFSYYTNGNGNGQYVRTFENTLEAVQYFVDVESLEIEENE